MHDIIASKDSTYPEHHEKVLDRRSGPPPDFWKAAPPRSSLENVSPALSRCMETVEPKKYTDIPIKTGLRPQEARRRPSWPICGAFRAPPDPRTGEPGIPNPVWPRPTRVGRGTTPTPLPAARYRILSSRGFAGPWYCLYEYPIRPCWCIHSSK